MGTKQVEFFLEKGLIKNPADIFQLRELNNSSLIKLENMPGWGAKSAQNLFDNIEKSKQVTLPKHWEDFNFSNNGDKLAMKSLGMDKDSRYLAIANSDGSGGKIIEYIGENDKRVYPSWSPNNQIVAMYTEGLDYDRQTVYFLGLNNENFKSTVIPGRGFQQQWSPNGDRLLYSVYYSENQMKPMLWIVDATGSQIGENRQMLNVQTWAEKCTFSGNSELYCAVPTSLDYGAGFLPSLADQIPDQIYKINTKTGAKQLVAVPDQDITISNLFVDASGNNLYFTNKNSGSINKIKLR
jgi:Tol biopolymer transport system component